MRSTTHFLNGLLLTSSASACFSHAEAARRDVAPLNRRDYIPPVGRTAITDVRVFNGFDFSPPQTIVIEDDLIGSFDARDANVTVNGTGKFLIPGLMDAHVHLYETTDLELLTSYGVTTTFQMSCFNYTACDMFRGHKGLTDFYTGSNPAVGNGSSHSKQFDVDPALLWYPDSDPVQYVDDAFNNGSDYYKITVETNGPSPSAQEALVKAAHSLGKMTMSHASTIEAYTQAIKSGTNGPQHIPQNGFLNASDVLMMKKLHQFATPTMTVFHYGLVDGTNGPQHIPQNGFLNASDVLMMKKLHQFATPTMTVFHYGLVDDPTRAPLLGSPNGSDYGYVRANVALLYSFGVPILAGTDSIGEMTTSQGTFKLPHGVTIHRELQLLVDAGLSPAEAINAATRNPAKWHRKLDRGIIAPGYRADLVLLDSSPLRNINNTLDISRVWVGGIEYKNVTKNRDAWASEA